jgi:hypothetical protein
MEEEALQDSYAQFTSTGYKGSIDDYKNLLSTNSDALADAHKLFSDTGYNGDVEKFSNLVGLKKKGESQPIGPKTEEESPIQEVVQKDGSSGGQELKPDVQVSVEEETTSPAEIAAPTSGLEGQEPNRFTPIEAKKQPSEVPSIENIEPQKETEPKNEEESWLKNLGRVLQTGSADLGAAAASYPEAIYRLFAWPQNTFSDATGIDFRASPEKFKEDYGVENTVLDFYEGEVKRLEGETEAFNENRYETSGIYDNIKKGNYQDAFELLGSGITRSAPISLAMMAGGAALGSLGKLSAVSTPGFLEGSAKQLREENPEMSESELTVKALGMAGAETLWSSIGTGTIGKVYKDILLKEGKEAAGDIFKKGLVNAYYVGLKKFGIPIAAAGEGIEEVATTITQNMIQGKPAFENIADSFIQGVGGGTLYGAPMTAKAAKDAIGKVVTKKKVAKVIKDTDHNNISSVFDFGDGKGIIADVEEVALNLSTSNKNRDVLENELKKSNTDKENTERILKNFDDSQMANSQMEGVDLTPQQRSKAGALLIEKSNIVKRTEGKDKSLVSRDLARITEINTELEDISNNSPGRDSLSLLPEESQLKFKEQAAKEIQKEYEDKGVKDYKINDQEITKRANEIIERPDATIDTKDDTIDTKVEPTPQATPIETVEDEISPTIELSPKDTRVKEEVVKPTESKEELESVDNMRFKPSYAPFKPKTKNTSLNVVEGAGGNSFEIATKDYKETEGVKGATIIGSVKDVDFPNQPKSATRGEVFILQVSDKGKGVGTSLMLDALRLMKNNGTKTVKFTVPSKEGKPFNEALERKGYIKKIQTDERTGTTEYEIQDEVLNENRKFSYNNEVFEESYLRQEYGNDFDKAIKKFGYKEATNEITKPTETKESAKKETEVTNETTPKSNTKSDADVRPTTKPSISKGKDNAAQPTPESGAGKGEVKVKSNTKQNERASKKSTSKTNTRAKTKSAQKNSDLGKSTKGKVEVKKRDLRGKTPLDKRKIKDKDMLKALSFEAATPYDIVKQFFISGGRVFSDDVKKLLGSGEEARIRQQYVRSKLYDKKERVGGKTMKAISDELWQEFGSEQGLEQSDFTEAVEDVIRQFTSPKAMAVDLNSRNGLKKSVNESGQELTDTPMGKMTQSEIDDYIFYEEARKQEDLLNQEHLETFDIFESLTDQEILKLSEEQDSSFEEMINKLDKKETKPKSKIDSFIEGAEKLKKDIDKSGKESLGMNIPQAILSPAISIIIQTAKATKSTIKALEAGLKYIKESDWYKNLSKEDKKEVTQSKMQEMWAAEAKTPEENFEYTEFIAKRDQEAINKKPSRRQRKKNISRKVIEKYSDRQFVAKTLLKLSGMQTTADRMINGHGASGKAKRMFDKAYEKIYADKVSLKNKEWTYLNKEDRQTLDKIIVLKRFVAIAKNRAKRGLSVPTNPGFISQKIAQDALDVWESKLGPEKFKDIDTRAKEYFKVYEEVLSDMLDNGLISQEAFDVLNGADYQPRLFLQHITDFDGNVDLNNKKKSNVDNGGLSQDQIKNLDEGSMQPLIRNSEWLLSTTIAGRYKAMATNNINKKFIKKDLPKAKERYKKLNEDIDNKKKWSSEDKIFHEYFTELDSKVKDNPVIGNKLEKDAKKQAEYDELTDLKNQGFTLSTKKEAKLQKLEDLKNSHIHKYDKTPNGFSKAYYYENGVKGEFFLEDNLHESWFNNIKGFLSPESKSLISTYSGSSLLKNIATGINPSFPIVNTPRDLLFTALFSSEYSNSSTVAFIQVAKDAIKAVGQISASKESMITKKVDPENLLNKYIEYGGDMQFLSQQGRLLEGSDVSKVISSVFGPRVRNAGGKVFSGITFQKISTYSEMMFRVALMGRTVNNELEKLGYKEISEVEALIDENGNVIETKQERIDDIYNRAVAEARSILDFNQGGVITKDMEAFIPYINTAVQGTRVVADAIKKNPAVTISKMLEIGVVATTIIGTTSLALIAFNRDPEDEEDKDLSVIEILLKVLKGVSTYKKTQYFIIPTGRKDEIGEYEYWQIAKTQPMTPIFSLTDNAFKTAISKAAGVDKQDSGVSYNDIGSAINNNIMPMDLSFIGSLLKGDNIVDGLYKSAGGTITRNPAAKAVLSYQTQYDFYRNQPITYDIDKDDPAMSGANDKNIEDFYKKFGRANRVSPAGIKAAVESFITTPSTNPGIGMMYGGAEYISASDKELKSISGEFYETLKKSTLKRMQGYTSPYNREINKMAPFKDDILELSRKNKYEEIDLKNLIKKVFNETISDKDALEEFDKFKPEVRKKVGVKVNNLLKYKDLDRTVVGLSFEDDKEVRAKTILVLFGDIDDPNFKDVKAFNQMLELKIFDKETISHYVRMLDEIKAKVDSKE